MGILIPFTPRDKKCDSRVLDGQAAQILSEKHKEVLQDRLASLTKSMTADQLAAVHRETLGKLKEINSSKEFVTKMVHRISLLHRMLFDEKFPKTKSTEKNIAAGLLYFLSPQDLLPDDVPGLGYLDDAYIITKVFKLECQHIMKYLQANSLDEKLYM